MEDKEYFKKFLHFLKEKNITYKFLYNWNHATFNIGDDVFNYVITHKRLEFFSGFEWDSTIEGKYFWMGIHEEWILENIL